MKKIFSLFMGIMLVLALTACGGASSRTDDALAGRYISVSGRSKGVTITGKLAEGFTISLTKNGKATIEADGTKVKGTWVNDDSTITFTLGKTTMVGKLGKDTITFEKFLEDIIGLPLEVKFAKEGTDATKPENILPDIEMGMLGDWVGVSVTDIDNKDASGEIAPTALKVTLNADHTSVIQFKDAVVGTPTWSLVTDKVFFDGDTGEDVYFSGIYQDGVFTITCSGSYYYTFVMEPAS